jgi:uncharacterized protein YggE
MNIMSEEPSNSKMYVLVIILSIAVVVLAAGLYATLITGPGEQRTLSVSGTSSQLVIPDTASLSIGVITRSTTAREASDRNAAVMNAIIGALKNLGLQDNEMRTSILSLQPVYNYSRDGDVLAITGYSASNNVEVTTKMLDKLGDIVDKSVPAGANQVSGITFMLSDEKQKQIREELIATAVDDANSRANKLAENLKVKIVSVKTSSISEVGFLPSPAPLFAEKAATPVLPGESQVTLSVQVTYVID